MANEDSLLPSKPTLESFMFADDIDDSSPNLDPTIDAINALLETKFNPVGRLLYNKSEVVRLIDEKELWVNQDKISAPWDVSTQTHATAIAHHLFTAQDNTEPCRQCKSQRSRGPTAECIAGGKRVVQGACFNCYYSGSGGSCSIRKDREEKEPEQDKKERRRPRPRRGRFRGFTDEMLHNATSEDIARWKRIITEELKARKARNT